MKLRDKMVQYRDYGGTYPIRMAAVVLAEVGSDSVMILNEEGAIKVIKKSTFRVMA